MKSHIYFDKVFQDYVTFEFEKSSRDQKYYFIFRNMKMNWHSTLIFGKP